MPKWKEIWARLKQTYQEWDADDAQTWAASVTFYTVLSLAPLLILAVAIAGFVFGAEAASGELAAQMEDMAGSAGAEVVQTAVASAGAPGTGKGIIATVISMLILLWGASKVFGELHTALNRIWGVRLDPNAGWRGMVRKRLTGFGMVLGVGLLLLLTVALSTFLSGLQEFVGEVPGGAWLWGALNFVVSIGLLAVVFGAMFKFVPDVEIQWADVAFGAVLTALLFTIGKFVLGIYLAHGDMGSAYGAASSLVVMLAWIYYSSQIFFLGAEYTQVHACWGGRNIRPNAHAVPLEDPHCGLGAQAGT